MAPREPKTGPRGPKRLPGVIFLTIFEGSGVDFERILEGFVNNFGRLFVGSWVHPSSDFVKYCELRGNQFVLCMRPIGFNQQLLLACSASETYFRGQTHPAHTLCCGWLSTRLAMSTEASRTFKRLQLMYVAWQNPRPIEAQMHRGLFALAP